MKDNSKIPADFNEKDLSADFVEYLADMGEMVWNKTVNGERTGLFFFDNVPASVRYSNKGNYMKFRFDSSSQKRAFEDMIEKELGDDIRKNGVIFEAVKISATEVNYYFWWE